MTTKQAAIKAITERNPQLAVTVSDALRNARCTYDEVFNIVKRWVPSVTPAEWEALLLEGDRAF